MHNLPVHPLPTDTNWLDCNQIGGELVLSQPVAWDASLHKTSCAPTTDKQPEESHSKRCSSDDDSESDDNSDSDDDTVKRSLKDECDQDARALAEGKIKVCLLHRSAHVTQLSPSGAIYQAALTCYARAHNTTESLVMDRIRQNRRFSTAPESARLQHEPTTGLYYDPETSLYYDPSRGYFYDGASQTYYYWSQSEHRYIQANALIQAEVMAAKTAQVAVSQAAASRAKAERQAASQAALKVAAQLAEIRASKDDYAAYAYATCVIPQQEMTNIYDAEKGDLSGNPIQSVYRNTAAAANHIEASLKAWDQKQQPVSLVPYADDPPGSDTPPPPGL